MSNVFHIDKNNNLTPLQEKKYEKEAHLQELISEHPEILAGEQINPDEPRRWILVRREMGIPDKGDSADRWAVDHMFLDQEAVPTFVEVKRSVDTRSRREVVAQMLDYAANAVAFWPVSQLRDVFEKGKEDPSALLCDKLGIDSDAVEQFWEAADNNLRRGKLRLLFVADEIPHSLLQIIEFLNNQMTNTEVLGLEIRRYQSENGSMMLVPKLVGNTTSAVQTKKLANAEWTDDAFLERVRATSGETAENVCRNMLADFRKMGCQINWGKGHVQPGFTPVYKGKTRHRFAPVYSYTSATKAEVLFNEMKAPLDSPEEQAELIKRFREVGHFEIPDKPCRPALDCKYLADPENYKRFMDACKYMIETIQKYEQAE